jgi:hypothetical protein
MRAEKNRADELGCDSRLASCCEVGRIAAKTAPKIFSVHRNLVLCWIRCPIFGGLSLWNGWSHRAILLEATISVIALDSVTLLWYISVIVGNCAWGASFDRPLRLSLRGYSG